MALWDTVREALQRFEAASVFEILSIAVLIYMALLLLKGTAAMSLVRGVRTGRWPWLGGALNEAIVDIVADACLGLAEKRQGAIIVLERETGLEDYIGTGGKAGAD